MLRILRRSPTVKPSSQPIRFFSGMLPKYHRNRCAGLLVFDLLSLALPPRPGDGPMKKLLIAGAMLASFAAIQSASAADLALKAPPPPMWNWTGWYVGGNIGYSWGRDNGPVTFSDPVAGPLFSVNNNTRLDGVIGGLQVGHNWQIQNWVYGLEADIQGSGQRGSSTIVCPGGAPTLLTTPPGSNVLNGACTGGHVGDTGPFNVPAFPVTDSLSEKLEWFGTFRGRVGPTINPTTFAYLTGGLAYGEIRVTNNVSGTSLVGPQGVNGVAVVPGGGSLSNSTIKLGWTIGCGIETVISGNWTGKIEYLYVDLGTVSGSLATNIVTPAGNNLIVGYSSHVTDNILRAGVNYQFH
jgi:outer membrane immunogenic protein